MAEPEEKAGGGSKPWVTILTTCLSVASAVYVAVITQITSANVAALQATTLESSIAVDRDKLRDQQDTRRLEFLKENIEKLLSTASSEQRSAQVLLRVLYPNDASNILQLVFPAGNSDKSFAIAIQEADKVSKDTGHWTIVIAADKSIDPAKTWIANATKLGYTPASLYLREGLYQTTVGEYLNRQQAELAEVTIRSKTRPVCGGARPLVPISYDSRRERATGIGLRQSLKY